MELDLGTFDIAHVVIHEMPKVKRAEKAPAEFEESLSEAEVELTPNLKQFFRGRITTSIAKHSFPAVYQKPSEAIPRPGEEPSSVPRVVLDYLKDPSGEQLVETSRELAKELYRQQGGSNSHGLLVVADARIMSGKQMGTCLAILKLEDDHALLVDRITNADGKATFDASVRPVTLPEAAKVFKAAIFPQASSLGRLEAQVSDHQRDANTYGEEIAEFFLKFLGCKLRDTADRATLAFVERSEKAVNEIADEGARARYTTMLIAELQSESKVIDPQEIAKKMAPQHRDAFLDAFKAPDGSVPIITKDLSRVSARLDNVLYEFAGGIKVFGPTAVIRDHVRRSGNGEWVIDADLQKSGPTGRR